MTLFDRFAEKASRLVASAPFFTFCVLLVVIWAPSLLIFRDLDTWQLIINTTTTIITFLMVAILENSTRQFENSTNVKLDAIATGLVAVMEELGGMGDEVDELLKAIGIEEEIGT